MRIRRRIVTISEAYEFLESIRRTEAEIIKLQLRHDELQSCLPPAGIRYDLDRVQSSPSDRMSDIEAQIVDIARDIQRMKEEKAKLIIKVNNAINNLSDDNEQIVLLAYYVGRLPVKRIMEITHYTRTGVYYVRKRAVKHLAEICTN